MYYAISDLHGCYDKYKRMLKIIRFCPSDTLYILGDVIDRGDGGIQILWDMTRHKNIIPLWGNHDYMAYYLLRAFYDLGTDRCAELLETEIYYIWMEIGGDKTYGAFQSLNRDRQKAVLDYMETFCFFREVEVNGRTFFLSHTVPDKSKMLDFISGFKSGFLEMDPEYEEGFLFGMPEYGKVYFKDRYIVTGHTPTGHIDEDYIGRICKKNRHIAIDCGAVFGAPLGCICLDTLEEFYTEG